MNSGTTTTSDLAQPKRSQQSERPLRKDAQRNRESLIAGARAAFARSEAAVSLESIARDAGVGIGTLYRHFPTRESLVEAVYSAELDDVTASVRALLDAFPADVALRAWMDRYAAFVATKRGMMDTLRAGWVSGRIATPTTRDRISGSIAMILEAGARDGTLRADVDPDDVTAILLGVFLSAAPNTTSPQVGRLLALVMDALRPRTVEVEQ